MIFWPPKLRKKHGDPPVFKPDFYIFSHNERLRKILINFNDKFLLYHTSLRRKAGHNFRGNLLENYFRHLKLYSNPPSWLARSRCDMSTFWKTKGWSLHFWQGQPFKFCYWEFTTKVDLNARKQTFLRKCSGSPRNQIFGLFSTGECLHKKNL